METYRFLAIGVREPSRENEMENSSKNKQENSENNISQNFSSGISQQHYGFRDNEIPKIQQIHNLILKSNEDALCLFDNDFIIRKCNTSFEDLCGYNREQLTGMNWYDIIQSEYPDKKNLTVGNVKQQFLLLCRNGETKYVKITHIDQPEEKGHLVNVFDITEYKETEQKLKVSKAIKEALINIPTIATAIIDRQGKIVDLNRTTAQRFGKNPEEMKGTIIWDYFPEEIAHSRRKKVEEAFQKRQMLQFSDCREGICNDNILTPILDPEINQELILVSAQDITQNIENEQQKELLLNSMTELFCYYDLNLKIKWANKAAADSLGLTPEELMGRHCYELWNQSQKPCEDCPVLKAKHTKKSETTLRKTPDDRYWKLYGFPINNKNGELQGLIELGVDVTDQTRSEKNFEKQEKVFNQISESLAEVLYLYDPTQNRFIFVGKPYEKIWEKPIEEVLKDPYAFTRSVHPDDKPAFDEASRREQEEGNYFDLEYRIVMSDGRIKWIHSRNFPVKSENLTVGISEDITMRKQADIQRRIQEESYEAIFNSTSDTIFIHDASDGSILDVNQATQMRFGYSKEEFKNLTVGDLSINTPPYTQKEAAEWIKKAWVEGPQHFDWIAKSKNGEYLHYENELSRVKIAGKDRILVVGRDITQRKKMEEQILSKNRQLKTLNELKSNFLNVTSHELRTPMTAINGFLQMLQNNLLGDINEEQRQAIGTIIRNADRLDRLIDDILDSSRLESGSMKFIPASTELTVLIHEVQETMQKDANTKNIHLKTNVEEHLPMLIIDPDRVKQVLYNLIKNAVKFSDEGSTVQIVVKDHQEMILFQVVDQGRGIPLEEQSHLFEPFYQVESGLDRSYGGTGLGLTICRGIVVGHGGKIWVESTVDEGSTFSFTLPKKPVSDVEGNFGKINIFNIEK